MKVINVSEIKEKDYFNYGYFSNVYKVKIGDKYFAYKEYIHPINPIVKNTLCELTDEEYTNQFLTPKYLIESKNGRKIIGYLSNHDENLTELNNYYDFNRKIEILKNVKNLIEKWHKESKRIHGDINMGNILVNDSNKPYLLDFDTALRINSNFNERYDIDDFPFSDYVYEYLSYYPFNEEIDIFMFDLTTLLFLSNEDYIDMTIKLKSNKLDFVNKNKDIKRLSKRILFEDTRKSYGKECIIDYF